MKFWSSSGGGVQRKTHRASLGMAFLFWTVCALPATATEPQADFDQGINVRQFLQKACELTQPDTSSTPASTGRYALPLPPVLEPVALPDEIARLDAPQIFPTRPTPFKSVCGRIPPDSCAQIPPLPEDPLILGRDLLRRFLPKGFIFGPFAPIVTNNQAYLNALQYPPLLKLLPPDVGGPLLSDWDKIESTRSEELLPTAETLDVQDQKLYDDRVILNAWRKRIEDRKALIDEEKAQYEAQCLGGPLPPPEYQVCMSWYYRLRACINASNSEVRRFNAKLGIWNRKRDEIQTAGAALSQRIKKWEDEQIKPFAEKSEKALNDGEMTSVVIQAQGGGLQKSVKMNVFRPVTVNEGLTMLNELWAQLTDTERETRDKAIVQARDFVWETSTVGGVTAPPKVERNFHNPGINPKDARIDVVLYRGRAFVFSPARR